MNGRRLEVEEAAQREIWLNHWLSGVIKSASKRSASAIQAPTKL
jgi:hypothetical protein